MVGSVESAKKRGAPEVDELEIEDVVEATDAEWARRAVSSLVRRLTCSNTLSETSCKGWRISRSG